MAAPSRYFYVPAQRLDAALIALGSQAQITIGGSDARLAQVHSKAVRGTMPVDRALRIMLHHTDFEFQRIDSQTIRVFHVTPLPVRARRTRPPAPPPPLPPRPAPTPPPPKPDLPPLDIVVTATKQGQSLANYPGTAHIEEVGGIGLSENQGTAAFVARVPSLAITNLGPGRNKLFVRGIADSSFSGPTQSTAGLYLGDLRLTYNAPEPDLRLYDIDRIEVIEGPQGTLYGAGTLGGVVRITPNMAKMDYFQGEVNGGVSATAKGKTSFDLGGMVNIPIIKDRVALRIVGYSQTDGGYINNVRLGTRNTNRIRVEGGRANLRIRPGHGWTIDLNTVSQNIDGNDGQYAERGLPDLSHSAAIAQPHDNDFWATGLEIHKEWGQLSLVSSTGTVRHSLSDTFDASGYLGRPGVQVYKSDEAIRLIAHETRLSRNTGNGGSWVAGVSLLHNIDRVVSSVGPIGATLPINSLRNAKTEIALFGEATQPIGRHWAATLGGRFVHSIIVGELLGSSDFEPRRDQSRFLPTAALSWNPNDRTIAFLRYQSGFRSGGISINSTQPRTVDSFVADKINTIEVGVRLGESGRLSRAHLAGGVTFFYSAWRDIQADLISANGLPFTGNIGRGEINGLEANARWRPTERLTVDAAVFVNLSSLTDPAIGFSDADKLPLPNIARLGGHFSLDWQKPISGALTLKFNGTMRYTGRSNLGTTVPFVIANGKTIQADFSAGLDGYGWALSLDVTNLLDVRSNNFSYGNPFTAALGQQITPLRPRTIRLGVKIGF